MRELKKITTDQLQLGMFVAELCGPWTDHPFWNTRFRLASAADLEAIHRSPVAELWIDPTRGLDVAGAESGTSPRTRAACAERIEHALLADAACAYRTPATAALAEELPRAALVCHEAAQTVDAAFAAARRGASVDLHALEPVANAIAASVARNAQALASLARLKRGNDYDRLHAVAVSALLSALGHDLGLPASEREALTLAGLVHDIGKAALPVALLDKAGKLTPQEFALIRTHPLAGHRMLEQAGGAGAIALDVCLHHHEKMDGTGYPHALAGDALSRFARMAAVCDVYDAVTSERAYKAGWNPATALRRMADWGSRHFDVEAFRGLLGVVGLYPVGSLVRLESGLLAVVSDRANGDATEPVVTALYCTLRDTPLAARRIDLASDGSDRIVAREDASLWRLPQLERAWAGADVLEALRGSRRAPREATPTGDPAWNAPGALKPCNDRTDRTPAGLLRRRSGG